MDCSMLLYFLLLFIGLLSECSAHECYVCSNQTGNTDKCLNTVKICEQGEDACLTEIRWGSTPYFSLGAQKQFYVSKRCAKKEICQRIRTKHMPYCTHIWYEDWTCSACCLGDRCNYYLISAAPSISSSRVLAVVAVVGMIVRNILCR
uniref:UPAR/Ly6 domain-containing protein n=1 Tax=Anopheles atroparvus TaxID=41427 RepID=A0AAG5DND1_ANOAO